MSSTSSCGCSEYQMLSRRQFMLATGAGGAALALPAWLPRVAFAQDYCSNRDVVICVFLRGACDGLTLCVPHTEDIYYDSRPTLAVPRPDSGSPNAAIDLDGTFGFHPVMAPLVPAFQAQQLLVVHAVGSPDPSRSHFDAMRFMEVGKPRDPNLVSGWLGRHLAITSPTMPNAILRAVGIGYDLQQSLYSGPLTLPIPSLAGYRLSSVAATQAADRQALTDSYNLVDDPARAAAQTALQTIDLLSQIDFDNYQPQGGAVYPVNTFGQSLKSVAALIRAEVGVEAVACDLHGFDHHNLQGTFNGQLENLLTMLADGLAAFHADMFAGNGKNITILVMTEFGRRLLENGSLGTDHGHGSAMLVIGNHIVGGRILTQWPGLQPQNLFEGRDLAITIDYRDILAEIVYHRLGNPNLGVIFPDFTPTFRGVTEACARGDLNCDGASNVDDVPAFVQALAEPDAYSAAHPTCNRTGADANNDGQIDARDVQAFIQQITP